MQIEHKTSEVLLKKGDYNLVGDDDIMRQLSYSEELLLLMTPETRIPCSNELSYFQELPCSQELSRPQMDAIQF